MLTMKDILLRLNDTAPGFESATTTINKISALRHDISKEIELREPIKSDFSQSNPRLHALYVNWAMQHLLVINEFIDQLDDFSNLYMLDTAVAVRAERAKLIDNNAAYRDAAARLMAGHEPVNNEDVIMNDFDTVVPEGNVNVGSVEDDGDLEDGVIHIFIISDDDFINDDFGL